MISYDKFKGCLFGLATGDALGYPLEFKKKNDNLFVTEMIQRNGKSYPAGTWTDDTSMAICLAESILDCKKLDPKNQLEKYSNWLNDGYMSCVDDKSFGSGKATRKAVDSFNNNGSICNGDEETLGNGSVMRIAPIPMMFINHDAKTVANLCSESSKTTHNNATCCYQCARLGLVIFYLLKYNICKIYNVSKNIFTPGVFPLKPTDTDGRASVTVDIAFWSILSNHDFESTLISAINHDGDSDSYGAVAGSLAGALYGYSAIPERWIEKLQKKELLYNLIDRMWNSVKDNQINISDL